MKIAGIALLFSVFMVGCTPRVNVENPLVLHCADHEPHPRYNLPANMDRWHHDKLNLRCSEIPRFPTQRPR